MRTKAQEITHHRLRAMTDGESAMERINYLTQCLATGKEQELHSGENGGPVVFIPLDDLRTKQVGMAIASYTTILGRVLPALKPMDFQEAMSPAVEGRDFTTMDKLDLANRIRVIFEDAVRFKREQALLLPAPEMTVEEFLDDRPSTSTGGDADVPQPQAGARTEDPVHPAPGEGRQGVAAILRGRSV